MHTWRQLRRNLGRGCGESALAVAVHGMKAGRNRRAALLVRHLEKEQKRELFDVVAVSSAITAASMLLRSLSAVSQSLASKPMVAVDWAEGAEDFARAIGKMRKRTEELRRIGSAGQSFAR